MPTTPPLSASAAGVADDERAFRRRDRFGDRPRAAVRQVEQLLFGLDPLDRGVPELRQPGVAGFERAVARLVAPIVGQLDDADPEAVQHAEPVEIEPDHRGVLGAEDDRDPARGLGGADLGSGAGESEYRRVGGDQLAVEADVGDRRVPVGALVTDLADGDAERGDAAVAILGKAARAEAEIALLVIGIVDAGQAIDDDRAVVARRIEPGAQRRRGGDQRHAHHHLAPCRLHRRPSAVPADDSQSPRRRLDRLR